MNIRTIKISQTSDKLLQTHYLSKRIQNVLIEIAGNLVKDNNIIQEIRKVKYSAIAVDGTPDAAHNQPIFF